MRRNEPVEVVLRPGGNTPVMRAYGWVICIVCYGGLFLFLLAITWKGLVIPALQAAGLREMDKPAEKPVPPMRPEPLPPPPPPPGWGWKK